MNKTGRFVGRCRLFAIVIFLYAWFLVDWAFGQESANEIKPEKPVEAILKGLYVVLQDQLGFWWTLIILVVVAGVLFYLVKEAIPKLCAWIFSGLAGLAQRLRGHNLQGYLKSVVDECKEVRVGYKNFDIDVARDYVSLRIRTGKSERDIELKEATDVLRRSQWLVVRGHPGSGKTTLLKYLAVRYATRKMKPLHGKHLIPVFVALKDIADAPDLFDYIVGIVRRHVIRQPDEYLRKHLKEGNCIVFFDGVDEVPAASREKVTGWIEAFAGEFGQSRMIVTLRKEGYEKIGFGARFEETEVAGLTEPQMMHLAFSVLRANRVKLSGQELHQQSRALLDLIRADDRLLILAENPMLLSIIALVYDEEGDLPRKRVELYECCVRLILELREIKEAGSSHRLTFSLDQKYHALRKIALHFVEQGIARFPGNELKQQITLIGKDINVPVDKTGAFIEELCIIGILRRISVYDDTYDFVHKTFLEYFAAREIQENQRKKERLIYENAEDPNWRQVILLYVGLLGDAGDAKEVLTVLMKRGYFALAGECFLNTRIPIESLRSEMTEQLLTMVDADSVDKGRCTQVLMDMFLPHLGEVIDRPQVEAFLQRRVVDPLERWEVKAAIYQAGLELDSTKAGSFASRFGLVYVPGGNSVVGVAAPRCDKLPLWFRFIAWIKQEAAETRWWELPREEVDLPPFFIDRCLVTNEQYAAFIRAGGYGDSKYWSEAGWEFVSKHGLKHPQNWSAKEEQQLSGHPVVGVSWFEAAAYAKWAGKQLPSERIWEKAARGTDERIYPWGNEPPDKNRANFGRTVGATTSVGRYEAGKSPYGAYDMAGNVWEWCEEWWDEANELKVLRGGSWLNDPVVLRASDRDGFNPSIRDWVNNVGFRCARTP